MSDKKVVFIFYCKKIKFLVDLKSRKMIHSNTEKKQTVVKWEMEREGLKFIFMLLNLIL